jgi:hypothetical protein
MGKPKQGATTDGMEFPRGSEITDPDRHTLAGFPEKFRYVSSCGPLFAIGMVVRAKENPRTTPEAPPWTTKLAVPAVPPKPNPVMSSDPPEPSVTVN